MNVEGQSYQQDSFHKREETSNPKGPQWMHWYMAREVGYSAQGMVGSYYISSTQQRLQIPIQLNRVVVQFLIGHGTFKAKLYGFKLKKNPFWKHGFGNETVDRVLVQTLTPIHSSFERKCGQCVFSMVLPRILIALILSKLHGISLRIILLKEMITIA